VKFLIRRTFIEGFKRHVTEDYGKGNSFQRGPVGKPGGGWFTITFQRQMKEGSGNGTLIIK
jgi:hypothetical protein